MVGSKPSRTVASGRRLHQQLWRELKRSETPSLGWEDLSFFPSLLDTASFNREQNEAGRLHRLEPWYQTAILWVCHSTVSCQPFWQAVSCSQVPSFTEFYELQERDSQAPWIPFVWAVSVLQWLFSQDSLQMPCFWFFHSMWEFMFFPACGKGFVTPLWKNLKYSLMVMPVVAHCSQMRSVHYNWFLLLAISSLSIQKFYLSFLWMVAVLRAETSKQIRWGDAT